MYIICTQVFKKEVNIFKQRKLGCKIKIIIIKGGGGEGWGQSQYPKIILDFRKQSLQNKFYSMHNRTILMLEVKLLRAATN